MDILDISYGGEIPRDDRRKHGMHKKEVVVLYFTCGEAIEERVLYRCIHGQNLANFWGSVNPQERCSRLLQPMCQFVSLALIHSNKSTKGHVQH